MPYTKFTQPTPIGKSGYIGVRLHVCGRYEVRLSKFGEQFPGGYYDDIDEACAVYRRMAAMDRAQLQAFYKSRRRLQKIGRKKKGHFQPNHLKSDQAALILQRDEEP